MAVSLPRLICLCGALSALSVWADDAPAAQVSDDAPAQDTRHADPPRQLIWSAGLRLKMDDTREPGRLTPRPMIGLRYGRWRTGPVDGDHWHRFGQIRTDNNLTYDWLDSARFRTSLSASIVNLQKDTTVDILEPGRKTLRGRATVDYLGWSHWSVGLVATQDLLGRGAGTALSPNVTYRQALSDDSTILITQSFTWATSTLWATNHQLNVQGVSRQGSGWGSMDTILTLRQRWKSHVSWYAQLSRSHTLGPLYPVEHPERTIWSSQVGVIYFGR